MENLKNKSIALGRKFAASYLLAMTVVAMIILMALGAKGQSRNAFTGDPVPFNNYSLQVSKVRSVYTSQIGIREKQPNSGKDVEKYLRYVNLPKGNPWCAAFVCWVFGQANIVNPRTGWSPDLFPASRTIFSRVENGEWRVESGKPRRTENGKLKTESDWAESRCAYPPLAGAGGGLCKIHSATHRPFTPSPGDIFGLYFPEKGRIAHVGFIDVWGDTWVTTVEGNTNVLGSREGDGVYRKRRLVRSVYRVARYVN